MVLINRRMPLLTRIIICSPTPVFCHIWLYSFPTIIGQLSCHVCSSRSSSQSPQRKVHLVQVHHGHPRPLAFCRRSWGILFWKVKKNHPSKGLPYRTHCTEYFDLGTLVQQLAHPRTNVIVRLINLPLALPSGQYWKHMCQQSQRLGNLIVSVIPSPEGPAEQIGEHTSTSWLGFANSRQSLSKVLLKSLPELSTRMRCRCLLPPKTPIANETIAISKHVLTTAEHTW